MNICTCNQAFKNTTLSVSSAVDGRLSNIANKI